MLRYDHNTEIAYRHEVLSRLTAQASPTWRERRASRAAARRAAAAPAARDGKALRPATQG